MASTNRLIQALLSEADNVSMDNLGLSSLPSLPVYPVSHKEVIQAIESVFRIKVESEDVDQGVYLHVQEDDAHSILAKRDVLEKVCARHNYAILKEGSIADIQYGPFGSDKAVWVLLKL